MKIRAIALDDEPPALRVLTHFCQQVDWIELIQTFTQTREALEYLKQFPVDLMLLDINMPSMSGIDFYKTLASHTGQSTLVIFTTAYAEYAVDGFSLNAVDYLLKPFTFDRFRQAAQKALDLYRWQQADKPTESYLFIRADYTLHKIALADILFVEGLDDYLKIHLLSDTPMTGTVRPIVTRMTMKALQERLPASDFMRVHRSYIVSRKRIESIRNKTIVLAGHTIPIGASYEADVLARLGL